MMRKAKGIDPQMPSSNIANQVNRYILASYLQFVNVTINEY